MSDKAENTKDKGAKIHFKKNGEPFSTRRSAALRMGVLRNNGVWTKPIELDTGEGWVLQEIPRPEQTRQFDMVQRNILTAPTREGYHRRFVNDTGDRVEQFLNMGWSVVTDDIEVGDARVGKARPSGSPVTKDVGLGVTAVLMEIPQEIYDARQKVKQDKIAEGEKAMALQSRQEGSYGNVKVTTSGSPSRSGLT